MSVPVYDIFSGSCEYDAVWLETAHSLDAACHRMTRFAATAPGPYFVICYDTGEVVTRLNTTRQDPLYFAPNPTSSRPAPHAPRKPTNSPRAA